MLRVMTAALLLLTALTAGRAQDKWPAHTVTVVVPFGAGGTTDLFGRMLTQGLQAKYGTPFVVENRAGAGGNLGAAAVARGKKDGYTLLVGTVSTQAINPFIYKLMPFDAEKDLQPVSLIARLPNILVVNPKLPVKTVTELIAYMKANPGKLSYGSSGVGTSTHLAAELFQIETSTKMVHIPYRSSGDVMNNLIGGHVDLAFDNITLAWPHVQAGALRALAVTSTTRSAIAPDVPTMADTLPGFEATSWHGLFAPTGTPPEVVDTLAAEVKRIFTAPETQKALNDIGAVPSPMTPDQFTAFIAGERKKWEKVVKEAGVSVQ